MCTYQRVEAEENHPLPLACVATRTPPSDQNDTSIWKRQDFLGAVIGHHVGVMVCFGF